MTLWIQARGTEDEGLWTYLEIDDEGWATWHVDLQGAARLPVTAAALTEVQIFRDTADLAAMAAYEQCYGVLAEGRLDSSQSAKGTAAITAETFELIWTAARQHLDALNASPSGEVTT